MPASRAQQAVTAERRAKLIKRRLDGALFEDIWEELGYSSISSASKDFSRALEIRIAEQRSSIEIHRETEVLRLDAELDRLTTLYAKVEKLLDKEHITVSNGRVVLLHDEPIEDIDPILRIVDRLIRIDESRRKVGERRAKLLGLDAPQRMEVLTIDDIDAQIRKLNEQLATFDGEAGAATGAETTPD